MKRTNNNTIVIQVENNFDSPESFTLFGAGYNGIDVCQNINIKAIIGGSMQQIQMHNLVNKFMVYDTKVFTERVSMKNLHQILFVVTENVHGRKMEEPIQLNQYIDESENNWQPNLIIIPDKIFIDFQTGFRGIIMGRSKMTFCFKCDYNVKWYLLKNKLRRKWFLLRRNFSFTIDQLFYRKPSEI